MTVQPVYTAGQPHPQSAQGLVAKPASHGMSAGQPLGDTSHSALQHVRNPDPPSAGLDVRHPDVRHPDVRHPGLSDGPTLGNISLSTGSPVGHLSGPWVGDTSLSAGLHWRHSDLSAGPTFGDIILSAGSPVEGHYDVSAGPSLGDTSLSSGQHIGQPNLSTVPTLGDKSLSDRPSLGHPSLSSGLRDVSFSADADKQSNRPKRKLIDLESSRFHQIY